MLSRYVWRDLVRNPRRSLATLIGVTLGVGLFSSVLFFIDGSSASMTQRAVAPLPLDMQRVLTSSPGEGLRLTERLDATGRLDAGQRIRVHLELVNHATVPANEVVLRSEPSPNLAYVPGSVTLDGAPLADVGSDSPLAQGAAKTGLNLGTIPPGATVTADYVAKVTTPVASAASLHGRTSFSSREVVIPTRANAPAALGLNDLAARISKLDGVAYADELSFVDLSPGSLSAGSTTEPGPVRVFGFGSAYQRRQSSIKIVKGSQVRGQALISAEAASALKVGVGDTIAMQIPGGTRPTPVVISGITDLSRARALFYSRQGANLEDFLYVRNSIVVDPGVFATSVFPTYETANTTRGEALKSVPIREVDVGVQRARLNADPGTALDQTTSIARAVTGVATEQDYLIDNISNTLRVARDDASVAKRMFIFLGIPGGILAAALAAYAGIVLAGAQRREQATLRIRGANRRHLLRMLALRTLLLTATGSVIGVAIGFLSALAVLGSEALSRAAPASLVVSGFVGAGGGFLVTGTALYIAGRRSINREINEDRARITSRPPVWRRARLDVIGVAVVALATGVAISSDAFAGTAGSVYNGRGVDLKLILLILPLGVWIAGTLLLARGFARAATRRRNRDGPSFTRLVWALMHRSVGRRPWSAAEGMIMVALVVALGTSIASFTASYDRAKATDARFVVGSDVRVTLSPISSKTYRASYAAQLQPPGISAATPVVFHVQNAVLRSAKNEDAANVAAVNPSTFLAVGAVDDSNFVGMSARRALTQLARDPTGVFLSTEIADFLTLDVGGTVHVLFAQGTPVQKISDMHVIGLFERLPGFPEGAQALVNISHQQQLIPTTTPDFFLARTSNLGHSALTRAVAALRSGPGSRDPLQIDTRETALDKDQSSLAALNIQGLLTLDSSYALMMGAVAIAIFVFGLLLQRRREYVTLRAQGVHAREIRALIVAETIGVAVCGCLIGVAVGVAMAYYLVNVLRPLFIIRPPFVLPAAEIGLLAALVIASAIVSAVAATSLVNRLKPTELLRDE